MKNTLKLDHERQLVVMDRTFAKKAQDTRREEHSHLQNVRRDYPDYRVIRRTIRKNPNKDTYKGLTYDYMRVYIAAHAPQEKVSAAVVEFDEKVLISRSHSSCRRYPAIKAWFLEQYPEVKEFGRWQEETEPQQAEEQVDELAAKRASQEEQNPAVGQ